MKNTRVETRLISTGWRTAGLVLLTSVLCACSPAQKVPPPVVVSTASDLATLAVPVITRDPVLRQIGTAPEDVALQKQINTCRAKLPEEYRSRNNFACALARIEGLEKTEYFAHSSIQDLSDFSADACETMAGISLKPVPGTEHYRTLCVNQAGAVDGADCWSRDVDTEYKILEDITVHLPETGVRGSIRLFTELYPCPSCWNVMKQFLAVYSNVELEVVYRTP